MTIWKTKIEEDPQHEMLRRHALEALKQGHLKWRHHGIGVLQAYLREGDGVEHRLHIWSRSLIKPGIDVSGDAHDHRFDMVSHVLSGSVANVEWDVAASPRGTWTTMTLVHARAAGAEKKFHAPMQPTGKRYTRKLNVFLVYEGQLYRFPARTFHQTLASEFAITWVEKHNQTTEPACIVHPIDIPAVPAFGHDVDQAHVDHLVQLAAEVLGS